MLLLKDDQYPWLAGRTRAIWLSTALALLIPAFAATAPARSRRNEV